jgi:hypothetical protein
MKIKCLIGLHDYHHIFYGNDYYVFVNIICKNCHKVERGIIITKTLDMHEAIQYTMYEL